MLILNSFLAYAQIAVAVLLIASILVQQRGVGLSSAFGGESNIYRTKRGFEKTIFISSITLGILFITLSILNLVF